MRTKKKNENDTETSKERKPVEKRTKEEHQNDVEVEDKRQRNVVGNTNLRAANAQLRLAREDGQGCADGTGCLRSAAEDVALQLDTESISL